MNEPRRISRSSSVAARKPAASGLAIAVALAVALAYLPAFAQH
jgi:hypothetical protein